MLVCRGRHYRTAIGLGLDEASCVVLRMVLMSSDLGWGDLTNITMCALSRVAQAQQEPVQPITCLHVVYGTFACDLSYVCMPSCVSAVVVTAQEQEASHSSL